ncbi:hypothetical protein GRX03_12230 [Halovenus sp. WSH3]|uniref:Uncharacterized protein n=1 Tax=Halovenus carboxidivorans TaxID=2692199 RepID=A0A6B0T2A3_9EURY|nr:DUF5804 family protein [Halovenus carboxidivorans]MXR52368.1 hypothetical protein [Halovenus carboxidivorans]
MTRVCLLGEEETNLQYELLSRETARDALAAYEITEPFENALAVETVSLGAAVSLLNDLDWYLTRFVSDAFVRDPSISSEEWLSRALATAIRNDDVDPADSGRFLRVYGVETDDGEGETKPRLVEPMLVTRTGAEIPEYDLREVDRTVIVRLTESEFGA